MSTLTLPTKHDLANAILRMEANLKHASAIMQLVTNQKIDEIAREEARQSGTSFAEAREEVTRSNSICVALLQVLDNIKSADDIAWDAGHHIRRTMDLK